jgi:glucose/arabinose dehydrogenase
MAPTAPVSARWLYPGSRMINLYKLSLVTLIGLCSAAQADDFPPGMMHDLVAHSCTQCHSATTVISQHKTASQWADTIRRMKANGAAIADDDFDGVVSYLAKNFADNRAPGAKPDSSYADYRAVPGQPIQNRAPEKSLEVPAFSGQTRAPFQTSRPYRISVITDKLHSPWSLAFLPDGKFLVTEKRPAAMRIVGRDGSVSAPLANLASISRVPDFGLLDVALDPKFAVNHRIFFTFFEVVAPAPGAKATNSNTYVARATLDEGAGALRDVSVIFRSIPEVPSKRLGLKTGGRIAIGQDGNLFITIGDRSDTTPWDVAQNLDTDLGKIIHITPDGAPAADNPFLGRADARPEIWTYGNRSEEGLAFRPGTSQLWETEHGPRGGDELNLIQRGRNYGWPVISYGIDYDGKPITGGITQKAGMEQPVYFWDPVIAPSGLAFYQGDLFPDWKDSVFVGGLRGLILTRLKLSGDRVVGEEGLLTDLYAPIRDVRVGPEGAVYVLTDKDSLLMLTPKAAERK